MGFNKLYAYKNFKKNLCGHIGYFLKIMYYPKEIGKFRDK